MGNLAGLCREKPVQLRILRELVLEGQDHILEEQKAAAKDMAAKLENITLKIESKGGDSGKLFGSITSKDIAEALEKQEGMKIDKKKIEMKNPIKQAGETEVTLKLFTEISAQLKVSVTIA